MTDVAVAEPEAAVKRSDLARVAFVAIAAAAVWLRLWEPFPSVSVIGLGAALIGGYPIFKEAARHLMARRMTMELSMTVALGAALVAGEFSSALVITLFVLAARRADGRASRWRPGAG